MTDRPATNPGEVILLARHTPSASAWLRLRSLGDQVRLLEVLPGDGPLPDCADLLGAGYASPRRALDAVLERLRLLAHRMPGVAGVYDRHDYVPEMRCALQRWADHIDRIVSGEPAAGKIFSPCHPMNAAPIHGLSPPAPARARTSPPDQ